MCLRLVGSHTSSSTTVVQALAYCVQQNLLDFKDGSGSVHLLEEQISGIWNEERQRVRVCANELHYKMYLQCLSHGH